ncbi:MAG: beta-galactosidase, partial [Clostridia bacterium]|nr:beta-galactosidase [Clostridia bacterium]
MMNIPRPQHPKPQFCRNTWQNLNGEWQFEIDHGKTGEARGLHLNDTVLADSIVVPFCPESNLSGVEYTDFMASVWYKRTITITKEQLNGRVVLHFGAVDYECTVYVNGEKAGSHQGGYISFSFDITDFLTEGENVLTVCAVDDTRSRLVPSGKQSDRYQGYGCFYTRSTGIWQTVWLEFTPQTYVRSVKFYPQPETNDVKIVLDLVGKSDLNLAITYEGKPMGNASVDKVSGTVTVCVPLAETHLWEVGQGRLYDVDITFGEDTVASYFGLRSVGFDGMKFLLNGKSVFQRLILDQGYYPDGIYTAPDDKELENDVLRSMAMGFNGARLHQKIFEERFLYYCDKHGYLVWGEYPSWGVTNSNPGVLHAFLGEWMETLGRDFNHPSIIGWCPFNETDRGQNRDTIRLAYRTTKAID